MARGSLAGRYKPPTREQAAAHVAAYLLETTDAGGTVHDDVSKHGYAEWRVNRPWTARVDVVTDLFDNRWSDAQRAAMALLREQGEA